MAKTKVFDENRVRYEEWFEENKFVFLSELKAVKKLIPKGKQGVEIGIGTGLFAEKLGISEGIEPSFEMRNVALKKGLNVIDAVAEKLPYENSSKDFALMVTTVCFVDDILTSFKEVNRILKTKGSLVIGFVDKDSPIGRNYLKNKDKSVFYKDATFFSTDELFRLLKQSGFEISKTYQTVFGRLDEVNEVEKVIKGHGKGSFVVIKAKRK